MASIFKERPDEGDIEGFGNEGITELLRPALHKAKCGVGSSNHTVNVITKIEFAVTNDTKIAKRGYTRDRFIRQLINSRGRGRASAGVSDGLTFGDIKLKRVFIAPDTKAIEVVLKQSGVRGRGYEFGDLHIIGVDRKIRVLNDTFNIINSQNEKQRT